MNETGHDVDTVVASIVEDMHNAAANFERAAAGLLRKVQDPQKIPVVEEYIRNLQTISTGSLNWSYVHLNSPLRTLIADT